MTSLKNLILICCLLIGAKVPADAYYYDIQARIGGYLATSKQSKEAFQEGIPVYQLEASCFFSAPWEWVPWKAWINGSFMRGNGREERLGRTHSNLTILSAGLKYTWQINCFSEFYLGLGPTLSWLRMKTEGPLPEGFWDGHWHGHSKIAKKQAGVVLKSGYRFIWDTMLFDVFADYFVTAFHYKNFAKTYLFPVQPAVNKVHTKNRKDGHHRLDLGGFIFGGAFGVPF